MSVRQQPVSHATHIRAVLEHAAAVERSLPSTLAPELTKLNARTKPREPEAPAERVGLPHPTDTTGVGAPGGPYEHAKFANAGMWHLTKLLRDVADGTLELPPRELSDYVQVAQNNVRLAKELDGIVADLQARHAR